jgi:hypothetical protein
MEYRIMFRKGIDDLKSLYAFHGNSQGDESRTNSIQEYKDSKGWLSFVFDGCELTDEAIKERIKQNHTANTQYIEKLKADGQFGDIESFGITLQYNPHFDAPLLRTSSQLSNYRMLFLDFNEESGKSHVLIKPKS